MGDYDKVFAVLAEKENALLEEIKSLKASKSGAYDHDVVKKLKAEIADQDEKINKLEAEIKELKAPKVAPPWEDIKINKTSVVPLAKKRSHSKKKTAHK